jgi:hypothetical protein
LEGVNRKIFCALLVRYLYAKSFLAFFFEGFVFVQVFSHFEVSTTSLDTWLSSSFYVFGICSIVWRSKKREKERKKERMGSSLWAFVSRIVEFDVAREAGRKKRGQRKHCKALVSFASLAFFVVKDDDVFGTHEYTPTTLTAKVQLLFYSVW